MWTDPVWFIHVLAIQTRFLSLAEDCLISPLGELNKGFVVSVVNIPD